MEKRLQIELTDVKHSGVPLPEKASLHKEKYESDQKDKCGLKFDGAKAITTTKAKTMMMTTTTTKLMTNRHTDCLLDGTNARTDVKFANRPRGRRAETRTNHERT
eukprot:TRINITY_DN14295_c0_g1_i1.p1 TRINITY_DN14295_c0_g1~~TRINITY_DN14295_c0_g1_i1.p1  ORF type:complete len:112 (-),score=11.92 TRINITY_DN14295_c0_g1_i1:139-453(-)